MFKMQAAELPGSAPEPGTAPVDCLPDELLALLFRLLDSKTLLVAVPAVSARGGRVRGDAQLSGRECAFGRDLSLEGGGRRAALMPVQPLDLA